MFSTLHISRVHALAAVAAILLGAAVSHAENVRVTVVAVLASDKHKEVNERLKEFAEKMQEKDPKLTGFKLEQVSCESIAPGKSATLKLIGKETVEVSVNEKTDADGRVLLTVKRADVGEVTYACCCGKFVPFITNYYTAKPNSERLLFAVMAKPCQKSKKDPPKR